MICRNHVEVSEGLRRCSRCGAPFCRDCLVSIAGAPYCATCKNEQLLDVRSGVSTAANVDLASIGRRFVASFLDGLIIGVPSLILIFMFVGVARQTGSRFTSPFFLFPTIAGVLYQAAMLAQRGQTLGKMAMKIKVVQPDGDDITSGQAWGREVSRALLGLLYIVDFIPAFFTKEKRTIHDMLAGTIVVNWA
jgi:uncharacterized RDD family membrane protein YckC